MKVTDVVGLFRSVDRLLTLDEKYGKAVEDLSSVIDSIERRVTRLEAREDIVVTEAKAAAGAAATVIIADVARRVGRLEARAEQGQAGPSLSAS